MKALPFVLIFAFLGQVNGSIHPDSIYTYVYNKDSERTELEAKTTYVQDQKNNSLSILNYHREDAFSPLELRKIKTYQYLSTDPEKMEKVSEYKVNGGDKILNKSVSYTYNDEGLRDAITVSVRRGNEVLEVQSMLKSTDFDESGHTTRQEMYAMDKGKNLSKRQTSLNEYRYDDRGNIITAYTWAYTLDDELKSSTQKSYTYDHKDRILSIISKDNLTDQVKSVLKYQYTDGLKVKEYYVSKNEELELSWIDSTFYDHMDRISVHKKYRKGTDGEFILRKYFVHFYSEGKEAINEHPAHLANVKIRDFNNQSGEICISDLDNKETYTLSIYDALGRLVAEEVIVQKESHRLPIENMTGVLITTMRNQKQEIQSQKFILK